MSESSQKLENIEYELNELVFAQIRRASASPPWPSRIIAKNGNYITVRFLGDGRLS